MLLWSLLVLALTVLAAWVVASRFDAGIDRDLREVEGSPAATQACADLPPLLQAYLGRTALPAGEGLRWSRIEQVGEMRLKPDGDWKPFEAVQSYAVSEPSFVWKARFKAFEVVDSIVHGRGRLEGRLFGVLPVMKVGGAEATRAQLLRYLAEVVWVPGSISRNRFLTWTQLGDREVRGVLEHSGESVELRFRFDEQGDIASVRGTRDRSVGGACVPTEWEGLFFDYREVGGVRIPARGEVRWWLDAGPFCYWRGTITRLETG